jgi:hypothetical protein
MESSKPSRPSTASRRRRFPHERLLQKMSEVISLREKVAQAELAAHLYGLKQTDEENPPKT